MKKQFVLFWGLFFCFGIRFFEPIWGQEIDIIQLVPQLEKILATEKDVELRKRLIESLGKLSQDALDTAPVLVQYYPKEKNSEVRAMLLWTLNQIEPEAQLVYPVYLEALTDESEDVRENAVWSLGKLGEDAKEAVPSLVEALQDENKHVRSDAAWALGKIKFNAEIAVPALTIALKDESKNVRKEAAWALGEYGPEAHTSLTALMEASYDSDFDVRKEVRNAQQKIGSSSEALLNSFLVSLKHTDEEIRYKAIVSLGKLGAKASTAVEPLKELLRQEFSSKIRIEIIWTLSKISDGSLQSAEAIATCFSTSDVRIRSEVLLALHQMNAPAQVLFTLLGKALKDPEIQVLRTSIKIIREQGANTRNFFPAILLLLGHEKNLIREEAKNTLLHLSPPNLEVLSELEKALSHPHVNIREASVWAIGQMGPIAKNAYPALKALLLDPQEKVREQAKISIQQLGFVLEEEKTALPNFATTENSSKTTPQSLSDLEKIQQKRIILAFLILLFSFCFLIFIRLLKNPHRTEISAPANTAQARESSLPIPQLLKTLENSHWEMRLAVVKELSRLLPSHPELLYPLAMHLKDSMPTVCREVAWVLAHTEISIQETVATLIQNLKYEYSYPQIMTLWLFQKINPLPTEALQAVVQKLQEDSFDVRYMARQTLSRQETPEVIQRLISLLKHSNPMVRAEAVCALSQQKKQVHLFAPELISCLNDPDEDVCHQVVLALGLLNISPEELSPEVMEHFDFH